MTTYKVETKTDEVKIFHDGLKVKEFLSENGICGLDSEWYAMDENTTIVTIPKWKKEREKYIKAKIADCEKYGCE